MCETEQKRCRRVFVVGCAVERIRDWQQLDCEQAVRNALKDAGLKQVHEIAAGCIGKYFVIHVCHMQYAIGIGEIITSTSIVCTIVSIQTEPYRTFSCR